MTGPARSERNEGFTLVEMLVALSLLAIASALAVEGFAASRGAAHRIAAHDALLGSVTSAEMRLRDRLEVMVVRARFEAAKPYIDLDGGPDHLDFITAPSLGAAPTHERLDLDEEGNLVLESEERDGESDSREDRLLAGASTIQISYYGADANGAPSTWRSNWSRQPSPPELVRVRIGFPPGDQRIWPDLIVRPVAEVDADCVINADTGACRGRS